MSFHLFSPSRRTSQLTEKERSKQAPVGDYVLHIGRACSRAEDECRTCADAAGLSVLVSGSD